MTDRLTRELAEARRRPRQSPSDKYTRAATASQMTDAELLDETRGLPVLRSRDTERDRVRHARLLEELRARLLQRNADLALYQDHAGRTFPRPLAEPPTTDTAPDDPRRLAYEVRMMLSSVASHGPAALTTTDDPMYTAKLLRRLSDALEAAKDAR